jgi:hypothetical protein
MTGFWNRLGRAPATWLALSLVMMLELGVWWWFTPPLLVAGGFLLLGLVMLAMWPPVFARSGANAAAIAALRQRIDVETVARIQQLEAQLRALGADQAVGQLRGLREKLQSVTAVIEARLNSGELAFARYLGTAEQVYLSAIDNLHQVAISLTSVGSIDLAQIEQRLQTMPEHAAGSELERESLLQRRALALSQHDKIDLLLAQNETAMTALSNTAAALADVRTTRGHAQLDSSTAMAELEILASRAKQFDVSQ